LTVKLRPDEVEDAMRALAVLLLTGLLASCPIVCGPEECDHAARRYHALEGAAAPGHCSEEGGNCICQGAVTSDDVRLPDADARGARCLVDVLAHTPSHLIAHLTREGSPAGLAGWGGTLAACSFLQNFRC
jgi:hypothetical protein